MGNRGFWCFDAKIYQHIPFEWPNTNALIRVWLEAFYWALCLSFLPSEVWFLLVSVPIFPVKFWDLFYPLLSLSSLLSISHDNTSLNCLLALCRLFLLISHLQYIEPVWVSFFHHSISVTHHSSLIFSHSFGNITFIFITQFFHTIHGSHTCQPVQFFFFFLVPNSPKLI